MKDRMRTKIKTIKAALAVFAIYILTVINSNMVYASSGGIGNDQFTLGIINLLSDATTTAQLLAVPITIVVAIIFLIKHNLADEDDDQQRKKCKKAIIWDVIILVITELFGSLLQVILGYFK